MNGAFHRPVPMISSVQEPKGAAPLLSSAPAVAPGLARPCQRAHRVSGESRGWAELFRAPSDEPYSHQSLHGWRPAVGTSPVRAALALTDHSAVFPYFAHPCLPPLQGYFSLVNYLSHDLPGPPGCRERRGLGRV